MIFNIFKSGFTVESWAAFLACIIALLVSITMHEFAHAYAAVKCGDLTPKLYGRLSINPLKHLDWIGTLLLVIGGFGFAKPVPVNSDNFKHKRAGMALVSIAGVAVNIILAIVFSLLYVVCDKFITNYNFFGLFAIYLTLYFSMYNISLAVFNFIPIYPLDGYNFVMSFVKNRNKTDEFMQRYGFIFLILAVILLSNYIYYANLNILLGLCKMWKAIFGGLL